jgi:hypothetical protein
MSKARFAAGMPPAPGESPRHTRHSRAGLTADTGSGR